jgi:hypothetical protein
LKLANDANGKIVNSLLSLSLGEITNNQALDIVSQCNKEFEDALAKILAGTPSFAAPNVSSILGSM